MTRSDDHKLFVIMHDLLDHKTIDNETALYLDKIRNEIRTLTEIEVRASKGRESMYADIIGKWFLIYLLRNGRV